MFKGTRKAIERAPRWISGQHVKDPEIQIWTKDFHAAKVALNSLDRECKEQEINETEFLRLSLDLYHDFVNVRNCDQAVGSGAVPATTAAFAPIQSAVDDIKMRSHTHTVKMHKDIDELRSLLHTVEDMVHKTDRKKQDCEAVAHKQGVDYDDPSTQNIPDIQTYLQYHYHILSLVPQVLTQLDKALTALVQRQLGHQMYVFQTAQKAIATVLADLQLPSHVDRVDILQHWTTEIEPVVASLSKTRTIGSVAVMPPPSSTWQKLKHPSAIAHGAHNNHGSGTMGQQTKLFASNVGNSFHHGISYIYPVEAKFFNPRKGIFGEKEEYELKLASEGKEVEQTPSANNTPATTAAKAPEATEAPSSPRKEVPVTTTAEAPTTTQAPAAAPAAVPAAALAAEPGAAPTQTMPIQTAAAAAPGSVSTAVPGAVQTTAPAAAPAATTPAPTAPAAIPVTTAAPAATSSSVPAAAAVPVSAAQPTETGSAVPTSPTATASTQPAADETATNVLAYSGIAAPARASESPSLSSVDEHPSEGTSLPTASTTPEALGEVNTPDNDELL